MPERHNRSGHRGVWTCRSLLLAVLILPGRLPAATVLVRFEQDPGVARSSGFDLLATLPDGLLASRRPLYRASHEHSLAWHCLETDRPEALVAALRGRPGVRDVHPNGRFSVMQDGDGDPLRTEQWGLDAVGAESAWHLTPGDPGIVVAVIDTGVEPGHPDLRSQWAFNAGEDLDGDGVLEPDGAGGWRLDPDDLDGLDTDANGFVDDLLGWDFTDAPLFPATGDYMVPDNEPWDEHGHGTAVAGILGAARHNGVGITGLAPGCRILPLKAATPAGWLEEDDMASAVLYAVENGARVLNLSFGDPASSPLLEDVLRFAAREGVAIVASSGNTGGNQPRWPAAYPDVIAVGSARRLESPARIERSPSSTYGPHLALLAPGEDILTTARGGGWQVISGTSAAAPFVSAALALLLSREPDLDPAALRARLLASCYDLESPGWNATSGAGLLDAGALLALPDAPRLQIHSPAPGSVISFERFFSREIVVSAWGPGFRQATLWYGPERSTARLLARSDVGWHQDSIPPYISGLDWSPDSLHTLWLEMEDQYGTFRWVQSSFRIDDQPPRMLSHHLDPVIDGARMSLLLELELNEPATAVAWYGPGQGTRSPWRSQTHRLLLQGPGDSRGYLQVLLQDAAGLESHRNLGWTTLPEMPPPVPRDEQEGSLPAGVWLGQAEDWDLDGHLESVVAPWVSDRELPGPARAYRLSDTGWQALEHTWGNLLPRGAGDTDGDGRRELLLGAGGRCELWEATTGGLPDRLAWSDDSRWGAAMLRIPALGPDDLLLLADNTAARRFSLWHSARDTQGNRDPAPQHLCDLPSPWEREPRLQGPPSGTLADTDGVEGPEVWLADRSGHVYGYGFRNGQPVLQDTLSFPGWQGPGHWLAAVPRPDGDRLALLLHDPPPASESEAGARRWRLLLLGRSGADPLLRVLDTLDFHGVRDGLGDANALGLWTPDGLQAELALLLAPRAYSVAFEENGSGFGPVRQWGQGLAGGVLMALDSDGNGRQELWLPADGDAAASSRRWSSPVIQEPLPPVPGSGSRPLDERRILLEWQLPSAVPEEVVIHVVGEDLSPIRLPGTATSWIDSTLTEGRRRTYRLGCLEGGAAGPLSAPLAFSAGAAPRLLDWQETDSRTLELEFDRDLLGAALSGALRMQDSLGRREWSTSLLLMQGGRRLRVGLPADLPVRTWTLGLQGLRGWNGTWVEDPQPTWVHEVDPAPPLTLFQARVLPGLRIELFFSAELEWSSAYGDEGLRQDLCYTEPPLPGLRTVAFDMHKLLLEADTCPELRTGGPPFMLHCSGLVSTQGDTLAGVRIQVQAPRSWVPDLRVYPNPWRADGPGAEGSGKVRFTGLTTDTEIRIYDLNGQLQARLETGTFRDNDLDWDLQDRHGRPVPSGIYLYRVEDGVGLVRHGRLAVIR